MNSPSKQSSISTMPPELRLRSGLQLHRQDANQTLVLEDTERTKYYRLGEAEARFVSALMDSGIPAEAWHQAKQVDPNFCSESALKVCNWLASNELTTSTQNGNAARKQAFNPLAAVFFWKIPVANPEPFLAWILQYFGWLFGPRALILGLGCLVVGILQTNGHWSEFTDSYENLFSPWRWATLGIAWFFLKVVHETAHGVVCRSYGGKVNEAGLAMILLMPVAYVNVSSSWRFPSRWMRLHVTLAGVTIELAIAGLALILWNSIDSLVLKQIAADVVLLASVSSLLFNLNPLLKFDGYFALADATGVDNLYQLGTQYARYFGGRYILGLDVKVPNLPKQHTGWIKVYGLLAAIYRPFTVIGLIAGAAALFHGAGVAIAIAGFFSFICKPILMLSKHLWQLRARGELMAARLATRVTLIATVILGCVWYIPTQWTWVAPAVVQYDPPVVIRARSAGFVEAIHAREGDFVELGQPIMTLRNDELRLRLSALTKDLAQVDQKILAAQWRAESSELRDAESARAGLMGQIVELQSEVDNLTLCATAAGKLVTRNLELLSGTYIEAGRELALIGDEETKRLKVSISQSDAKQIEISTSKSVRVVIPNLPTFKSSFSRLDSRASRVASDETLLAINGGGLAAIKNSEEKLELCEPRVSGYISLSKDQSRNLFIGQRAYVRLGATNATVGRAVSSWLSIQVTKLWPS